MLCYCYCVNLCLIFCIFNCFKSRQIRSFHWTSKSQKCFSFRGKPPWPSDQGFCPWTSLVAPPQTPLIGASMDLQLSGAGTGAASTLCCSLRSIFFSIFLCSVVHERLLPGFAWHNHPIFSSSRCTCPYHLSLASCILSVIQATQTLII